MDDFTGWPPEAPQLLAGIVADNRAEMWDERHDAWIRGPALALAAALAEEFGTVRVLRPRVNRRFRPDAPPLRTDTGVVARSAGGCDLSVVLTAAELRVGAGHRRFDPGQTRRYRAAVVDEPGAALLTLCAGLADAGLRPDPSAALRRRPRGVPGDHPRLALLGRRGLLVERAWPVGPWLGTPEPLERTRAAWRAAAPLVAWLDANVGPSAPRPSRPRPARRQANDATAGADP